MYRIWPSWTSISVLALRERRAPHNQSVPVRVVSGYCRSDMPTLPKEPSTSVADEALVLGYAAPACGGHLGEPYGTLGSSGSSSDVLLKCL